MRIALLSTFTGLLAITSIATVAQADHLNIEVKSAKIENGMIVLPSVRIDKDGFVVIHAVKDGKPVLPESIGNTMVKSGTTENVKVSIEGGAKTNTDYVAMIHYDTNNNGKYEFGKGMTDVDTPGMRPDNTPYALPLKVAR